MWPAPARNAVLAGFPSMYGRDRFTQGVGELCRAAEGFEDCIDDGGIAHVPSDIRFPDIKSSPVAMRYPIFVSDPSVPSWQTWQMPDSAFDRDLVRAKMKEYGITQKQMADELGFSSQSAMANILSGERQVKVHEASYIYKRLGLERQADVHVVPIIGLASAGNWREAILAPGGVMPVPRNVAGKRAFAVEIKGDSMDKIIPDGGYAIVDPDQTQLYNDKVYLIQNGEHEAQVKVYRANPARFEPASNNDLHETCYMGDQHVKVVGRVVWQGAPL